MECLEFGIRINRALLDKDILLFDDQEVLGEVSPLLIRLGRVNRWVLVSGLEQLKGRLKNL